jgi:FKBP-type peptidyl-prolyl cis-trans isomerase
MVFGARNGKKEQRMKSRLIALLAAGMALGVMAAEPKSKLSTPKDKASYSIGVNIGKNMKTQGADLDPDVIGAGIRDALTGGKILMTDQEMQESIMAFRSEMQTKQTEKQKEQGDKNKKEGEAFLAENKKKDGIQTTPSGLQYKVVTQGTGAKPKTNDVVTTHYRGTLIDGTEFDSSYKRGEPASFPVTGVIKGWTEALLMMPVGSKWQLFIPSDLAYGPGGRPSIPPSSTLLFDIELIAIKDPADAGTSPAAKKPAK